MVTFESFGLNEAVLKGIKDLGFEQPSPIQEKVIPYILENRTDMVGLAQTGTGKTAAFGLPMIQQIDTESRTTQALVLSPTRELCLQITSELKLYAANVRGMNIVAVYGGANIQAQAKDVKRGAQIIVATPGRLNDMIRRKLVDLSNVDISILDEADEMLNMGFVEEIDTILAETPATKQTWLFSATMPKEVENISKKYMTDPFRITVGNKNEGASTVTHNYYVVNQRDRYLALKRLVDAHPEIYGVVFCRTKAETQMVAERLIEDGYNAASLHGDLSQTQRDSVMKAYRTRQIQILVATDVAARGIDVKDITHVINYNLPDEIEIYNHRSGRTGRAGKTGVSLSIVTPRDQHRIKSIERIIKKKFIKLEVPTGMEVCESQLFSLVKKVQDVDVDEEQIAQYLPKVYEELGGMTRDELIVRFISIEFNRFLDYYKNARDINASGGRDGRGSANLKRMFINLGTYDGFEWNTLKDYLKDKTGLSRDDLSKVDVMGKFSFFTVLAENAPQVVEAFKFIEFDGRTISVEISDKPDKNTGGDRRSSGGGRDRRRGGDRGKSNFRGDRDRGDRGGRSEGRSDRPKRSSDRSDSRSGNSSDGRYDRKSSDKGRDGGSSFKKKFASKRSDRS
ncbi:MAG: DEAD/DEAH box helicase [Flavobacteriales bacterium]|nr:DEAD/DEAH box helicase [Flavobacteriales bacterium]